MAEAGLEGLDISPTPVPPPTPLTGRLVADAGLVADLMHPTPQADMYTGDEITVVQIVTPALWRRVA